MDYLRQERGKEIMVKRQASSTNYSESRINSQLVDATCVVGLEGKGREEKFGIGKATLLVELTTNGEKGFEMATTNLDVTNGIATHREDYDPDRDAGHHRLRVAQKAYVVKYNEESYVQL
ncbi:hypothetical protein EVAR_59856_1 [Eumeta japonica]|uniref:Uncharacterized protein n=1 Tax=Eumeta variegata TaxID=151549 RepID=A0A4C1Z7X7_EUMVA|nr:hypothetical protein EVAR_59856_1 [Eumeta japonica]